MTIFIIAESYSDYPTLKGKDMCLSQPDENSGIMPLLSSLSAVFLLAIRPFFYDSCALSFIISKQLRNNIMPAGYGDGELCLIGIACFAQNIADMILNIIL